MARFLRFYFHNVFIFEYLKKMASAYTHIIKQQNKMTFSFVIGMQ